MNLPKKLLFSVFPLVDFTQKSTTKDDNEHIFEGLKGRVQLEYKKSPVGPYEGPYDQDPQVPLSAQLPKTRLSYDEYTDFVHPHEFQCKAFKIKHSYKEFKDLEKIDALEVRGKNDYVSAKQNSERVFYTCRSSIGTANFINFTSINLIRKP